MRADEQPMGSALTVDGPIDVQARALGTEDLTKMEFVTPGGVVAHDEPASPSGSLAATIDDAYVYCRVTQADGEMAWSSPIFFDRSL